MADAGSSFFAGFTVFSIVGYLSVSQGIGIENMGIAGPYLIFITYPTAINLLPFAALFGFIFYIALLTFGIDSAFSMMEPIISGINNKWGINKEKATLIICILGFFGSLVFITRSGIYWLEMLDHFIANFGLVTIGLVECLILGWIFDLDYLRKHANKTSDVIIGRWWNILIKFIIPTILIIILAAALIDNLINPYMNYPWWTITIGGIIPVISILILSFILMKIKRKEIKK